MFAFITGGIPKVCRNELLVTSVRQGHLVRTTELDGVSVNSTADNSTFCTHLISSRLHARANSNHFILWSSDRRNPANFKFRPDSFESNVRKVCQPFGRSLGSVKGTLVSALKRQYAFSIGIERKAMCINETF